MAWHAFFFRFFLSPFSFRLCEFFTLAGPAQGAAQLNHHGDLWADLLGWSLGQFPCPNSPLTKAVWWEGSFLTVFYTFSICFLPLSFFRFISFFFVVRFFQFSMGGDGNACLRRKWEKCSERF